MTPARLVKSFREVRPQHFHSEEWLKAMFTAITVVAKRDQFFTVDDIWYQVGRMQEKGKFPSTTTDNRLLGPILKHLVKHSVISSTGEYTKSIRIGGGSRPVTLWKSNIKKVRVAA
jgi:hypothetical protein